MPHGFHTIVVIILLYKNKYIITIIVRNVQWYLCCERNYIAIHPSIIVTKFCKSTISRLRNR